MSKPRFSEYFEPPASRTRLERAVTLYAKQFGDGATAVIVHTYPGGDAYEIEVLAADGSTLAVRTETGSALLATLDAALLSIQERKARAEATETVGYVTHQMALSGRLTSAESQQRLIEQETAEIMREKLLSKKEHK